MRLGDSLGTARFGVDSSAGAISTRLSVVSHGRISRIEAAGSVRDSLSVEAAGGVTRAAVGAQADANEIDVRVSTSPVETTRASSPTVRIHIASTAFATDAALTLAARYPELVATVAPRRDIPERERIEGYLKRPFETGYAATQTGGVVGAGEFSTLFDVFGDVAEAATRMRNDVLVSHMVDLAYGQSLDYIGGLLLLPRRTTESDSHYRLRLKAYARALTGEGTIDQIRETLALLLDCELSDVTLTEPTTVPARFDIALDETIIEDAETTVAEVVDLVMRFRAAGVKVTLSVTGSFTHRSVQDIYDNVDLGEKGYNEATYAGRLI